MDALHISALSVLASAAVRVFAAFLLFSALTRLSQQARIRHALWMIFVGGVSVYWLAAVASVLATHPAVAVAAATSTAASPAHIAARFMIPFAWTWTIGPIFTALAVLYMVGATTMLIRLVSRRRQLRAALSQSCTVDPHLQAVFERECAELGIYRCEILELPGIRSPGTAYVLNPVVILPDGMESYLDNEQFVDVLYHELIHVRRHDFLWNTVAELARCVLFFHPAMWLALRSLARDRELACDRAVMDLRLGRQSDYALCLTRLERRRVANLRLDPPNHLALLGSFLALRVKTLLTETDRRGKLSRAAALASGAAVLAVFVMGWSSLSLAIEIGSSTSTAAATPFAPVATTAHKLNYIHDRQIPKAPAGPAAASSDATAISPSLDEVAATETSSRNRSPIDPSLDGADVYTSGLGITRMPLRNGAAGPISSSQNAPDWQKAATSAAIGALGHGSSGKHGDDDGIRSATRPF